MIISEYNHFRSIALAGLDWDDNTIKLALFTADHVPDLAATTFASLANQVTGGGYPAGGNTLSLTVANGQVIADPTVYPSLTASFRYVVLYASGTVADVASPVLILYDLEAPVSITALDWTFSWLDGVVYELLTAS